ncbi:hypothetical protein NB231_08530 [Nitrococcus mobilis Nb-231]|uniref:Uncharacterized protein n=2 Tax=Nitrococcus mobilis TaxID=35797 RepID=A4BSL9_9GAMM|nr:hypothetical protein NB231_08530 [Nitrococcus mobilis Nb-231]
MVASLGLREAMQPEPEMSVARSVAEVLGEHTTLEVTCIDRMYLNVYQPMLQTEGGIAYFFRQHRGYPFASSSLMAPMSRAFVAAIDRFARQGGIDVVPFKKGKRKDALAQRYLTVFQGEEGVLFLGKTQGKAGALRIPCVRFKYIHMINNSVLTRQLVTSY